MLILNQPLTAIGMCRLPKESMHICACVWVCVIYIYFFFYDSLILSGRDKHIFLFERLNHYYPFLDNVIRWACCSVGRALHRNLRGQGFNSRTSLNFFFQVFSRSLSSSFINLQFRYVTFISSQLL